MMSDSQLELLLISARYNHKNHKREAFLLNMAHLTTIRIYQPTAIVFQNKEFQDLENEYNSLHIDY
jgi:hypothetical protein